MNNEEIRLNKYIATHMNIGRRQADEFIERGRVMVNNTVASLGARVNPGKDTVMIDSKPLTHSGAAVYTYIALHKPIGYVSSRKQQGDSLTIYTLLPREYHHLKPVGRLDKDSSGLLLLTNDGDFTHSMTHPSFYKVKRYEVRIDKPLAPLHRQMINDYGVTLDDGPSKLQLERMSESDDKQWIVTMSEGRNRQIRRTFASLGYSINSLHRTQFGKFSLDNIQESHFTQVQP